MSCIKDTDTLDIYRGSIPAQLTVAQLKDCIVGAAFISVAAFLASTQTDLGNVEAGGFDYIRVADNANFFDVETAGNLKYLIVAAADGTVCPEQFGVVGTPDPLGARSAAIKLAALGGDAASRAAAVAVVHDDSDALSAMGDYGRRNETLKVNFKPMTIYGSDRPWTFRNIRNLVSLNGYGAKWINLRASLHGADTTVVNNIGMMFEGHYQDQDPTTTGSLPIGLDSGGLLAFTDGDTIGMQDIADMADFKVGGRITVFGWCMQLNGSPQIMRYFEYATIAAINGLELKLTQNLQYKYDPQWPQIGTRGPAPSGKPEANGPPQVLSLDRGVDRFIETERLEILGLEYLPNPMWTDGFATKARNGRLTTGGARTVYLQDVKTPSSVYCFSSENTTLKDCEIQEDVEFDKGLDEMKVDGGFIGAALQGSGCKQVLLTGGADIGSMRILGALDRYTIDGAYIRRPHLSTVYFATTSGAPYLDIRDVTLGKEFNTASLFEGLARTQAFTIEPSGRLRCSLADLRTVGLPFVRHMTLGGILWHNDYPAYYVNRFYQDVVGGPDVYIDVTQITPNSISGFTSGDLLSVPQHERIDIGRMEVIDQTGPLNLTSNLFNQTGFLGEIHDGRRGEALSSMRYPLVPITVTNGLHPLGGPQLIDSIEVNVMRPYTGPTANAGYFLRTSTNNAFATVDLSTAGRRVISPGSAPGVGDTAFFTDAIPASAIGHNTFVALDYDNEGQRPIFNIKFNGTYMRDGLRR